MHEAATAQATREARQTRTLELWRRCRRAAAAALDDEGGWSLLLPRIEPYLRTVLRHRLEGHGLLGREHVDEALQEVFCRLLDHDARALRRCRARTDGELLAYLKRICVSVVQDSDRALHAQKRRGLRAELHEDMESDERHAVEHLLVQELRARLLEECRAVASSASRPRDLWIFERAVLDGWSSREIAKWVGLKQPSVDAVVCRLRQRLRQRGLHVPARAAGAPAG